MQVKDNRMNAAPNVKLGAKRLHQRGRVQPKNKKTAKMAHCGANRLYLSCFIIKS